MNATLRNLLAVIAGLAVGSGINMGLIIVGSSVIPAPAGMDVTNPDSVAANAHLFEARHFVTPFLAHALGTLGGAVVALLVSGKQAITAGIIGGLFLAGGIMAANMVPAPLWFIVIDLVFAYLPMAWLATRLTGTAADQPASEKA